MQRSMRFINLILIVLATLGFARSAFGNFFQGQIASIAGPPTLTGTLVIGSMPGVNGSIAHQPGVTAAANITSNQTLTSCNITAGDPSGNFSCVVNGGNAQIQMTATGAGNYTGSVDTASQSLTVTGTNGNGTSAGVTVVVNLYNDGYAAASSATALLPSQLNGYSHNPPWVVAGIGYGVGVPTGTTLSNPSSLSISGVSCNATSHICTVSGSSNVQIGNCGGSTGFDFSANGGWGIATSSFTGTLTIECSKFGIGANSVNPVVVDGGSLVLLNNSLDGAGNSGSGANQDSLVVTVGGVNFTAKYNQFTSAWSDFIDLTYSQNGNNGSILVEWNVFSGYGGTGTHADPVQTWGINVSSFTVKFNAFNEPTPSGGFPATAANSIVRIGDIQLHGVAGDCGSIPNCQVTGPVVAYNVATLLGDGYDNVFQIGPDSAGSAPTPQITNLQIHDNYIDPTDGVNAVFAPVFGDFTNMPNVRAYNNINLLSGGLIFYNQFNAFGATPPTAPPLTTSLLNVSDVITIQGTAPSGETITVYDGNTSLGTTTSSGGTFSFTSGTLSSGAHTITASDVYGNSSVPQSIVLP